MNGAVHTPPLVDLGTRLQQISRITLGAAVAMVALIVVASSFTLGLFSLLETTRATPSCWRKALPPRSCSRMSRRRRNCCNPCAARPRQAGIALHERGAPVRRVPQRQHRRHPADAAWPHRPPVDQRNSDRLHPGRAAARPGSRQPASDRQPQGLYQQLAAQVLITLVGGRSRCLRAGFWCDGSNRSVLEPLIGLTAIMDRVSGEADFRARAVSSDIAELDALARGFNGMLEISRSGMRACGTARSSGDSGCRANRRFAACQGCRRSRQPGQERIPRNDEPRDSHTIERRAWHERTPPRQRSAAATEGVGKRGPDFRTPPGQRHQRYSRFLQNRVRTHGTRIGRLQPRGPGRRNLDDVRPAGPQEGAGARRPLFAA